MAGIKIVGYIYDSEDRYPDVSKITKILEWPSLSDIITAGHLSAYIYILEFKSNILH